MCRNSSKRHQNDGISLNKHTTQWFVSWTSERHVIKCMSSFFSQNMSELWSYSYQCIVILTSFLYRHKWRNSAIIFGFQKFYLWKSVFSNNFAECKLPSKINIQARPNYISPRTTFWEKVAQKIKFVSFIDLFIYQNIDNLQILRYCKKLKNTVAYHIANLRQRAKYIIHTNSQLYNWWSIHTNIHYTSKHLAKKLEHKLNETKALNKWPTKTTRTIS